MVKKTFLFSVVMAFAMMVIACGGGGTPNQPAPAKVATPAKTSEPPKKDKPKPPDNAQKKSLPDDKKVPVPDNWETYYDSTKGYEFKMPEGSQTKNETHQGVDIFIGLTPKPSEVGVFVIAYKDKNASKEDLMKVAENVLKEMGETLQSGKVTELSHDYDIADGTTVDEKGTKSKVKILVATDVTDNYIMIVGTDEAKYKTNEQIIDAIWGSFSMYSGGYSGQS